MSLADAAVRAAVRFERAPLGADPTLAQVVAAVCGEERPFVLTGRWGLPENASPQARSVVAGASPVWQLGPGADPLLAFDEVPPLHGEVPPGAIGGGLVGWLGFDLSRTVEATLGPQPPRPRPLPAARLAWYTNVLRRDEHGTWWVEALLPSANGAASVDTALERWRRRLADAQPLAPAQLGTMRPRGGAETHLAAIGETIERIAAGELFQANVCLRLEGEIQGTAAGLVDRVLSATDPWYGGWIDGGKGRAIVSASPELFLRRTGREVVTHPIKGTAPRAAGITDPGADPAAAGLVASAKDQAEHVMIVDLMRNDLGRVCDYGSVRWEARPRLEAHAGVWHLVSEVGGQLHEDWGDGRLLRATFPPGSVTGAPKVQAMRVIAAVEGTAREVYTGALGISSPASGLELAVAIRTLEVDGPSAWLGVGGGIVADSRPESELAEALGKAAALVAAAGGTVEAQPPRPPGDRPTSSGGSGSATTRRAPWLPSASIRPDPHAGLIDTISVVDGQPRHLDRHLARLERSLRELGHAPLEVGTAQRVRDFAAGQAPGVDGRVRVIAVPDDADRGGRALVPQLQFVPRDPGAGPTLLAPLVVPGGLGSHKWLDRRFVDATSAQLGATPLLLDSDAALLEAGWANIWWVEDGVLWTPVLDGRQLPGVMRALLLERRAQAPLPIRELAGRRFDEDVADLPLLLTSARGVTPARLEQTPAAVVEDAIRLAAALQPLADEPA